MFSVIGCFRCEEKNFGEGAYGTVGKGMDIRSGSPIIWKKYKHEKEKPLNVSEMEKIFNEVSAEFKMIKRFKDGSHFLQLRSYDESEVKEYLFTDLISSSNVYSHFPKNLHDMQPHLNSKDILGIGYQLLECLVRLKEEKVIHADVKPTNLVYNKDSGCLTIIDFGAARKLKNHQNYSDTTTYAFQPPEAFIGHNKKDYTYDMWSLGVTLYFLCTGKFLFGKKKSDVLSTIYTTLDIPPETYFINAHRFAKLSYDAIRESELEKKDWRKEIRDKYCQDVEHVQFAEKMISFLSKIFRYENRLTVEDALKDPLFEDIVHLNLNVDGIPWDLKKRRFLKINDHTISLTEKCIHLPKPKDGQFEFWTVDRSGKAHSACFKIPLVSNNTLNLSRVFGCVEDSMKFGYELQIDSPIMRTQFSENLFWGTEILTKNSVVMRVGRSVSDLDFERYFKEVRLFEKLAESDLFCNVRSYGHYLYEKQYRPLLVFDLEKCSETVPFSSLFINRTSYLSFEEIKGFSIQLLKGLLALTQNGYIHTEFHPANMIYIPNLKEIKIFDLGMVKDISDFKYNRNDTQWEYRPPEMWLGKKKVDASYDMWSFGVMLFRMYTNLFPFADSVGICSLDRSFWVEEIIVASKKRGDGKADSIIDFLSKIFVSHSRIHAVQALDHPLFIS